MNDFLGSVSLILVPLAVADKVVQPSAQQITYAEGRLCAHGLIRFENDRWIVTDDGKLAAKLDLEPQLAKLVLAVRPVDGKIPSGAYEILVLIAILSGESCLMCFKRLTNG